MKFVVVAAGRLRGSERALVDEYLERTRRYVVCDEREVKTAGELARAVPADAQMVALEPSGDAISSTELSRRIARWGRTGKGVVAFVVGGADGIPPDLVARAGARLSLSSLTLPHRLARVILVEQLYRAMTILRGEPYARE